MESPSETSNNNSQENSNEESQKQLKAFLSKLLQITHNITSDLGTSFNEKAAMANLQAMLSETANTNEALCGIFGIIEESEKALLNPLRTHLSNIQSTEVNNIQTTMNAFFMLVIAVASITNEKLANACPPSNRVTQETEKLPNLMTLLTMQQRLIVADLVVMLQQTQLPTDSDIQNMFTLLDPKMEQSHKESSIQFFMATSDLLNTQSTFLTAYDTLLNILSLTFIPTFTQIYESLKYFTLFFCQCISHYIEDEKINGLASSIIEIIQTNNTLSIEDILRSLVTILKEIKPQKNAFLGLFQLFIEFFTNNKFEFPEDKKDILKIELKTFEQACAAAQKKLLLAVLFHQLLEYLELKLPFQLFSDVNEKIPEYFEYIKNHYLLMLSLSPEQQEALNAINAQLAIIPEKELEEDQPKPTWETIKDKFKTDNIDPVLIKYKLEELREQVEKLRSIPQSSTTSILSRLKGTPNTNSEEYDAEEENGDVAEEFAIIDEIDEHLKKLNPTDLLTWEEIEYNFTEDNVYQVCPMLGLGGFEEKILQLLSPKKRKIEKEEKNEEKGESTNEGNDDQTTLTRTM